MSVDPRDVSLTLEYRTATAIVRLLPTGLLLIFLGLFILALLDDREPVWTYAGIGLCFVCGVGLIGLALWTRSNHGKPLFTLSPAGIRYRIPWVKEFLIPWREIKVIETIDIDTTHLSLYSGRRFPIHFPNVTAVLVPKQFYDSDIHVDSFILRGPGWDANFIPKGSLVQVALHHEMVSCEPASLHEAVMARWLAFRDAPEPVRTSVPGIKAGSRAPAKATPVRVSVAMGDSPRTMSRWDTVKIAALLIGIVAVSTNMAGLWDMPGQGASREAQARARAEQQRWTETSRRMKEEWKKREQDEEKRRREFDETMRRAFSR